MDDFKTENHGNGLFITRISCIFGFDRLSAILDDRVEWLPTIEPAYLFIATALIFQFGVVDFYNYAVIEKSSILSDPGRVFIGVGTVLAVVGIKWMHDTHEQAISELQLTERNFDDPAAVERRLLQLVPFRIRLGIYIIGLVFFYYNAFVVIGFSTLVRIEGFVSVIVNNFLIIPLVQVPLIVEFGLLYFGIHVVLPRRIVQADLNLFFYDIRNMGGFGPIGHLLKRSYYFYTTGLLVYFGVAYWPVLLQDVLDTVPLYPGPNTISATFFSLAWFAGVLSIAYSMYKMHVLMARKKEEAIRDIETEIKALLDDPFDVSVDHIRNPDIRAEFEHKIAQVRATNQYPSTFAMWSQIGLSVLVPQALQLAVRIFPL